MLFVPSQALLLSVTCAFAHWLHSYSTEVAALKFCKNNQSLLRRRYTNLRSSAVFPNSHLAGHPTIANQGVFLQECVKLSKARRRGKSICLVYRFGKALDSDCPNCRRLQKVCSWGAGHPPQSPAKLAQATGLPTCRLLVC